jgi:hypothetical protein
LAGLPRRTGGLQPRGDPHATQRVFGTLDNSVWIPSDLPRGWVVDKNWLKEARDPPIIASL